METINKIQNAKNQSVEGEKIYKTRKYVQSNRTKLTAEARRKRDQYLIDHREEILKYNRIGRVKKVAELLKQDLNLDVNYKTLRRLFYKYVLTNQNIEPRRLRDQYLIDHKEEILKYDDKDRVKKLAELLKQDLNLDINFKTLQNILYKYKLIGKTKITSKNTEERKLRDKYLLDHKEEILKLEHKGRIKKVQEMLKRDLNLDVNYNKMYVVFTKYHLL